MKRGDIVELQLFNGDSIEKQKKYNALLNLNAEKLVILRQLDETSFLVALCRHSKIKTNLILPTNKGDLYIYVKQFQSVDESLIKLCDTYFEDSYSAVSAIYDCHNQYIERRVEAKKEKREKQNAKIKKRREEKLRQRSLEQQYKGAYDIAILNNDRKRMNEIESIVGGSPCRSGKGYATASCSRKVSDKYFNPQPLNGGRFTPK